jgi:hypothetical protein
MVSEVATFELKLDTHTLPLTWGYLKFRFTIGEAGLHCFNEIPKLTRNHTEKENDTILIHWLVA